MSRTLTRHHDQHDHGPALLPFLLLLLLASLTAAAPRELVPATDDGPIQPPAGVESIASAASPSADIARPAAAAPSGGYVRRDGRRVAALRPADLLHFRQLVAPRQRWRQRPDVTSGGQRVLIEISSAAALTAPGPLADGGEEEEEEIMPRRSTVRAAQEELLKKAASAAKDEKQRVGQEGGEEEERDVERREEEAQNGAHEREEEDEADVGDVEGSGFHEEGNTATPATMPLMPLDEERDEPVAEHVAERPVAQEPVAQEAMPEPVAEAMAEHMPEPVAEPVAQQPMAMHASEPVAEPVEETVAEPVAEPIAEAVAEESAAGRPAVAGQGAEMTAGSTPDVVMSRPDSPPSGGTGAGHVDAAGHGDGDGDDDDDDDDDSHTGMAAVLAGAALPAASVVDSGSAPGSASGSSPGSASGSAWSGAAGPSHPVSGGGVLPVTVSTETVRREARGSAPDQRGQLSTAEISAVAVGCVMAAAVVILGAALVVQRTGLLQRRSILSEPPLDDTRLSYINASTDFSVSELGDEMTNLENLDNDSFLNSLESMTDSMAGQTCWSREVRHLKL